MSSRSVLVSLALLLLAASVNAIGFTLRYGEETCIRENVIKAEYIAGEFTVQPEGRRVAVYVKDPVGTVVYHKPMVSEGSFAYTSLENGEYKVCFSNNVENNGIKTIRFKLSTGADTKSGSAAKVKNLKPLEARIQHIEDLVAGIRTDSTWLADYRARMNDYNKSIMSSIIWFNIAVTVLLAILSYVQVVYLKKYFRTRKIVQ